MIRQENSHLNPLPGKSRGSTKGGGTGESDAGEAWPPPPVLQPELDMKDQMTHAEAVSKIAALVEENEIMRQALERIERWHGEFPETGRYWDEPNNTEPMSYSTCFGSNGERDYMRQVARNALK